uniref:HpcH/HpaI aldolase/citrate lyase domain-containing protein n=1 Tax=Haptolina ericina TaxID=156174 RepID=A0A7S3F2J2_9EUKA
MKIGCAINTSSGLATELCASLGYDFLLIDQQHSAIDPEKLRYLLTAAQAAGSKTIVRVGSAYDRVGIQQALDMGSDGILIPCSRTAADVKNAISCSKYPVTGPGSEGGTRSVYVNLRPQFPGGFPALFDYVQHRGNAETIIAAQIETKDALDNIEEICALDGLDIAFIGPGDLCTDMGLVKKYGLPNCFGSEEFGAAVVKIAETCKKNNKIAGFWNSDVEAQGKLGFRFMVVDGDIHAMQAALQTSIAEKREKIKAAAM